MRDERKRIVATGYDTIATRYLAWGEGVEDDPRERMVGAFAQRLPDGSRVLDLGCGAGIPSSAALALRFNVVGVDISERQVESARRNVPAGSFLCADMAEIAFPDASFDAVVGLYSVSHVPRQQHAELFSRIARWLVPGGLFLATLGAHDSPDWQGEWLGVPMFFSSHDADTNRTLVRDAGFELLVDEVVEMREPEGPVSFLWVIAQRPA